MPRTRDFEDDDNFETVIDSAGRRVKVLRDGARVRTPMFAMDAMQRDVARSIHDSDKPLTVDQMNERMVRHRRDALVTNGTSDPWSMSRPGFRFPADRSVRDAAHQRVADARAAYLDDLTNSWRTPPATNIGAHEHASPVEGGSCTTSGGASGTYQLDEDSGELVCVADPRVTGNADGRSLSQLLKDRAAVMTPLYEQIERELSEAWRTK